MCRRCVVISLFLKSAKTVMYIVIRATLNIAVAVVLCVCVCVSIIVQQSLTHSLCLLQFKACLFRLTNFYCRSKEHQLLCQPFCTRAQYGKHYLYTIPYIHFMGTENEKEENLVKRKKHSLHESSRIMSHDVIVCKLSPSLIISDNLIFKFETLCLFARQLAT